MICVEPPLLREEDDDDVAIRSSHIIPPALVDFFRNRREKSVSSWRLDDFLASESSWCFNVFLARDITVPTGMLLLLLLLLLLLSADLCKSSVELLVEPNDNRKK